MMKQYEGDAYSKWDALIKEGTEAADACAKIELATISSLSPFTLVMDKEKFPVDDVIVADHLLEHKREARIDGGATVEIEFQSTLKDGDRVLVACLDVDMTYIVLAKARWA